MTSIQRKLILAGACGVTIPVSFYGGLVVKEYLLSKELDGISEGRVVPQDRALRARIVELAKERQKIILERNEIDQRLLRLQRRMNNETSSS